MNCFLINADTINAYWAHGILFITAAGETECVEYANISQAPLDVFPPDFQIMSCACATPGSYPYRAHGWFILAKNPDTIKVHTLAGPRRVKVEAFPEALPDDVKTPSLFTTQAGEGEVVGISPNSFDVNVAISHAVNQLHESFPNQVRAVVTETGVVTLGGPVGMAFLYVKMKQSAPPPPPPPEPPPTESMKVNKPLKLKIPPAQKSER
jgi:hypothetical protein